MKFNKFFRYCTMAGLVFAMSACSEDSYYEPSKAGVPDESNYKIGITVDDATNSYVLNILDANGQQAKGVYPIWYVNGAKNPSTSLTYTGSFRKAGDYPVEMKVGNANGVSKGSVNDNIHIANSIGADDVTTTGFKYDGEHNLWKDANVTVASTWFADGSWAELSPQPVVTLTPNKGFSLTAPAGTGNDGWMGQVHVETDIEVHSGTTYDFSCKVNVPKDGAVIVKPQKLGDDNVYFTDKRVDVESNGYIIWLYDVEGFDGTLKIAFDFGGFGGCDITVDDIVFKEHQYDDGTVIPAAAIAPEISDEDNIFSGFEVVKLSTWFAAQGWDEAGADEPEISLSSTGYSFVAPANVGTDQWHAQVHMWTNVETSAENKYDFMLTIEADNDIPGVTVKIQKGDSLGEDTNTDDNTYFVADRIDVLAGEPAIFSFKGKKGIDTKNVQVCMDYAGIITGTNVTVKDIKMAVSK